jgi:hypothetical protein
MPLMSLRKATLLPSPAKVGAIALWMLRKREIGWGIAAGLQ